jgi:hypothetical protein
MSATAATSATHNGMATPRAMTVAEEVPEDVVGTTTRVSTLDMPEAQSTSGLVHKDSTENRKQYFSAVLVKYPAKVPFSPSLTGLTALRNTEPQGLVHKDSTEYGKQYFSAVPVKYPAKVPFSPSLTGLTALRNTEPQA